MDDSSEISRARTRAGSLSQRDLARIGERLGWEVVEGRGKGSHLLLRRTGRRPITVPKHLGKRLALQILDQLEDSS